MDVVELGNTCGLLEGTSGASSFLESFAVLGSGFYYNPITEGVTLCRNGLLRNENFAADGAVLTFGKSRFGTSCIYRLVNYLGVTERINCTCFVVVASITITAFCTCGGTGGCGCDYPITEEVTLC